MIFICVNQYNYQINLAISVFVYISLSEIINKVISISKLLIYEYMYLSTIFYIYITISNIFV
jgi:hypothetical protein